MILPALYHWAPASRRDSIRTEGLRPFSPPTVCTGGLAYDCICLGFTPSGAWGLSGGIDRDHDEVEHWDLWQVRLSDHDEVHIRPLFGDVLTEIKVRSPIPPDRIWWVAERTGDESAARAHGPRGMTPSEGISTPRGGVSRGLYG